MFSNVRKSEFVIGIVAVVLSVLAALPLMAQDVESTPDVVTTFVEVAPADDALVLPPGTAVVPVEALQPSINWSNLTLVLLAMFSSLLAGGSFAFVLTTRTKAQKDEVERSYEALPPKWQTTIQQLLGIVGIVNRVAAKVEEVSKAVVKLGGEVTDGLPNTEPDAAAEAGMNVKPKPSTSYGTDAATFTPPRG